MRKTFNIRGGNYADVMNPTLEAFALVICNWYFRAMYQLNMVMLHSSHCYLYVKLLANILFLV